MSRSSLAEETFGELAAAFEEWRWRSEVALVAGVVADPRRGLAVAEAAGSGPWAFEQEDLRLIYCAAAVLRSERRLCGPSFEDKVKVFRLGKLALRREGWWDKDGPLSFSCRWNDQTLARLFFCVPYSNAFVHAAASMVLELRRREAEAEEHLRAAWGAMWEGVEQAVAIGAVAEYSPEGWSAVQRRFGGG